MGILFVHELLCYTTFKTYYDKWSCRPLLSAAHVTPRWHIKMLAPHNTEHSTQDSGYKTGGLHYSSCAHSAFHVTISGHQQKVTRGEEDNNSSGQRTCTCLRKCKVLDSFSISQCNTSVQSYQATDFRHRSCIKPFWAATISE